jgi:hypothetical protein
MSVGDNKVPRCSTYEGRKVSMVAMCEVRSKGKMTNNQTEKNTMVNNKKKWTVMNPI